MITVSPEQTLVKMSIMEEFIDKDNAVRFVDAIVPRYLFTAKNILSDM